MYSNNSILLLFYIGFLQIQTFVLLWDKIFGITLGKCWVLSLHNCCACNEQTQSFGSFRCPPLIQSTRLQPMGGSQGTAHTEICAANCKRIHGKVA